MKDEDLLAIVQSERRRSIGFDLDSELTQERERALNYIKGYMPDVPSLPGRSKAVSLDVADAIETILPDVVEIFTAGDDVVSFSPIGEEDEDAAQQETDYVRHVIFNENPGFLTLTSAFKDAFQAKTGVFKWWWEEKACPPEAFKGKTAIEMLLAEKDGKVSEVAQSAEWDGQGEPLYDFTLTKPPQGRAVVDVVAPEDITVSADTVWLPQSTYCATRSRPRAQDLIAQGIDPDLVDALPAYSSPQHDSIEQARDTVSESSQGYGGEATKAMRQVEVVEHYVRVMEPPNAYATLYQVLTGGTGESAKLLRKQKVNSIQLSAITPFLVTHRFYGESIADKLMEVQKIKTALTRMDLDSGYFALNQRNQVDMTYANEWTISDLLRNEPGVPVRTKGAAILPIQSGGLGFDAQSRLEYWSTEAEKRSGIVRNAQGLNPDTLHDTAKGAAILMGASQKRIRMIARIFAETGVKDLFMGVHDLLRQHAMQSKVVKLRNKWTPVNPSSWSTRNDMTIEVGLGASGREHDLAVLDRTASDQAAIVSAQGGLNGPLVKPTNIYALAIKRAEKAGIKNPEAYFSDPATEPPAGPPPPDPKVLEAQAKMDLERERMARQAQSDQARLELDQQQALANFHLKQQEQEANFTLQQQKHEQEVAIKHRELDQRAEQIAAELQLKREELEAELALKARGQAIDAMTGVQDVASEEDTHVSSDVEPGGEPG